MTSFHHVPSGRVPWSTLTEHSAQVIRSRNRPSLYPVYRNHGSADVLGRGSHRDSESHRAGAANEAEGQNLPVSLVSTPWGQFYALVKTPLRLPLSLYPSGSLLRVMRVALALAAVFANFPLRSPLRTRPDFTPAATSCPVRDDEKGKTGFAFPILEVILSRRKSEQPLE